MTWYGAIDVGGTKVAVGIFDSEGKKACCSQIPTDRKWTPDQFVKAVSTELIRLAGALVLDTIGICLPSYLDQRSGTILKTVSIPLLQNCCLSPLFHQYFGEIPILFDNDANAAALSEYNWGAGRGHRDMVYVAFSTGIGGGLILNGHLYRGSRGMAGEIGHMLITPGNGPLCGCGNRGCVMGYSGGIHIPYWVAEELKKGNPSSLRDREDEIDGNSLLEAYLAEDAVAVSVFHQIADSVALMCFNLYQVLDVDLFVFGGGLTSFGLKRISSTFFTFVKEPVCPVSLRIAQGGKDCGLLGAYA
jgi:glucokinase